MIYNPSTNLVVKLDRKLTCKVLESVRAKVSYTNNLLRRLAGSSSRAISTSIMSRGAQAEYASPHGVQVDTPTNLTTLSPHFGDRHRLIESHPKVVPTGAMYYTSSSIYLRSTIHKHIGPRQTRTDLYRTPKILGLQNYLPAARFPATQHR